MSNTPKRVFILIEQDFQDLEVFYPLYRLREEGMDVIAVGTGRQKSFKGKYGLSVEADRSVHEVDVADMDGLVIPGGWAPDFLRRSPAMVDLVRSALEQGKVVASICHGGWMLASTRAIAGRRMTSFFAIRDDLENAGAEWVDEEVVIDGNLITSRKPDDLPAFMKATIDRLAES